MSTTARPNFLLIVADGHRADLAGFAGSPIIDTTALDHLADHAAQFTQAYCPTPTCAGSRMAMLTGRWPARCDAWGLAPTLPAAMPTLPAILSRQGYATAAIGRLGFAADEATLGFDARPWGDLDAPSPLAAADPPGADPNVWLSPGPEPIRLAGPTKLPESQFPTHVTTTESLAWMLEFIDRHRRTPWCCMVSYSSPQSPLTAPGRYIRRYQKAAVPMPSVPADFPDNLHPFDRIGYERAGLDQCTLTQQEHALAAYLASLDYLDDCLADMFAKLWEIGALDRTYVIYTADHGEQAGQRGLWWADSYYDDAIRVPLLISGPNIPNRSTIHCPTDLTDLLPTICDLADVDPPADLDGESLAPVLIDPDRRHTKPFALTMHNPADPTRRFRAVRCDCWKYVDLPDHSPRLFDLSADPHEERDLTINPPNDAPLPEMQKIVKALGDWPDPPPATTPEHIPLSHHPC